ncbi:MAG: peptidyl-prolyl cis-trans isomerase [Phycisphaerae bacterium]|nr:peptidyl-prolyl cis-trans isomerase [Phycisphaerae bacterium]
MKVCAYLVLILSAVCGMVQASNPQVTLNLSGAVSGSIVLELYADKAPVTVANFIQYVQSGHYAGLIFHRVISGFMIQGGGYDTNLVKRATQPAIVNESSNGLSNTAGTLAMARTPYPHSATSEFFINQVDNVFLNYAPVLYDASDNAYSKYGYCVFGRVVSGMELVNAIAALPTTTKGSMSNVPVNNVIIQCATITQTAPVCAEKPAGDLNGDCSVDFEDFVVLAQNWMKCNSITPE